MSHYITDKISDAELAVDLASFYTVANNNKVVLGLQAGDITEIQNASTNFNTDLTAWIAAKAAADNAKGVKDTQRATSRAVISKWAKVFRANQAVPDALLSQLMLAPHKPTGSKTPPTQPTDLVANSDGNGNITLRWNRNGNIQGTQFIIEYKAAAGDAWAVLSSTSRASFQTTWSPGQYVSYRVIAKRNGQSSAPSTPVVLWDGTGGLQLQIAA